MKNEAEDVLRELVEAVEGFFGSTVILTGRRGGKRALLGAVERGRKFLDAADESPQEYDGVDDHDRRLGEALREAGFPQETVNRARQGHWSDFKTPLDAPKMELVEMLKRHRDTGNEAAGELIPRVMAGEFDG